MNVFRPIGIAGLAWRDTARGLTRWEIWGPALSLAALELLLLLVLVGFHLPPLVPWALPWVRALGGEFALHYPGHLYALPSIFGQASLVSRTLLQPIVAGILCVRFARLFGVVAVDAPRSLSRSETLRLVAVGILATSVPAGVEQLLVTYAPRIAPTSVARIPLIVALVTVATLVLLVYCVPAIVLHGHRLTTALWESARTAVRKLVPTFLVVSVPLLLLHPFAVLVPRTDLASLSLRPELATILVVARIAMQAFTSILIVGASTRLFVTRRGDHP